MCHPDASLPVSGPSAHISSSLQSNVHSASSEVLQERMPASIILPIPNDRFLVCSNRIYISFSQKRIDQLPVSQDDQISQLWDPLIRLVQKDAFRFGCGLDSGTRFRTSFQSRKQPMIQSISPLSTSSFSPPS